MAKTGDDVFAFSADFDHHQMVRGALLVLRKEADRQRMTMPAFLKSVGLLTEQDEEIERELWSFTPGIASAEESRQRLLRSSYYRQLLRQYRPELLKALLGDEVR